MDDYSDYSDDAFTDSDSDLDLYGSYNDSDCDLSDEDQIDENKDPMEDPLYFVDNSAPVPSNQTLVWSSDVRPIRNIPFNKENCGIQINITETSTPRDVFDKLFTSEIMDMLVVSTNVYGNELYSKPVPASRKSPRVNFHGTNNTEMYKFLGLCLLLGQSKFPKIRLAFSKHPLYYTPIFPATMSGRRFQMLLRTFCCHMPMTKAEIESNKISRVSPLLQKLLKTFNDAFVPHKELSLDESLLLWRGRLSFRQFIKDKAAKYGIKFYELTTSDGYVLNVIVYQGKNSDEPNDNSSKTAKIVLKLMQPYLDRGHHLYMDNFYNSVSLSTQLLTKQTHTTGTLRSDRKDNPKSVVQAKLKKGEISWQRCGDVYVNKWKDKRDVLTISTAHHPKLVEVKNRHGQSKIKPEIIADYNRYMSGIDRSDQMISYYHCSRKTIRWYKKVLFHLIDVAVWNSYYIYKQIHPKTSFLTFRDTLIESLIQVPDHIFEGKQLVDLAPSLGRPRAAKDNLHKEETPASAVASADRSTLIGLSIEIAIHQLEKIPVPNNHKRNTYFQRCAPCSDKNIRKDTSHRCIDCPGKPPMCQLCFNDHQVDQSEYEIHSPM